MLYGRLLFLNKCLVVLILAWVSLGGRIVAIGNLSKTGIGIVACGAFVGVGMGLDKNIDTIQKELDALKAQFFSPEYVSSEYGKRKKLRKIAELKNCLFWYQCGKWLSFTGAVASFFYACKGAYGVYTDGFNRIGFVNEKTKGYKVGNNLFAFIPEQTGSQRYIFYLWKKGKEDGGVEDVVLRCEIEGKSSTSQSDVVSTGKRRLKEFLKVNGKDPSEELSSEDVTTFMDIVDSQITGGSNLKNNTDVLEVLKKANFEGACGKEIDEEIKKKKSSFVSEVSIDIFIGLLGNDVKKDSQLGRWKIDRWRKKGGRVEKVVVDDKG